MYVTFFINYAELGHLCNNHANWMGQNWWLVQQDYTQSPNGVTVTTTYEQREEIGERIRFVNVLNSIASAFK